MSEFHRPARFPSAFFDETFEGGADPERISRLAHDTAAAIVARVRGAGSPEVIERIVTYTDEHGIDEIAVLWASAAAHSLPGALWRLYVLRALVVNAPRQTALEFQRGLDAGQTPSVVVVGSVSPTSPEEIRQLIDEILRGVYTGDLADALDRAAAFATVLAAGLLDLVRDAEGVADDRAGAFTRRAARLRDTASVLTGCARAWRDGALD